MTKNRPLIGINTDYRAVAKGRTPHSYMHSGYFDCLLAANALPVIIPPLTKEIDLAPILDRLSGHQLFFGSHHFRVMAQPPQEQAGQRDEHEYHRPG